MLIFRERLMTVNLITLARDIENEMVELSAGIQLREVEDGELRQYVDTKVFGSVLDSLRAITERKKAVADETRYSILYLLYETKVLGRKTISALIGQDEEGLEYHLRLLRNANLIARVNTPDGVDRRRTYYRITPLGQDEIESDIRAVHSQFIANRLSSSQSSFSELYQLAEDVNGSLSSESGNPEELKSIQNRLKSRSQSLIGEEVEVVEP
jgi:DNA-binding MarR family transcriptional regulator